jgi:HAD superfamily hydrolase (TIGR01509 family)
MKMNSGNFKNIIFDLGGVILNLSIPSTLKAFADVSGKSVEDIIPHFSSKEFLDYEKGLISDEEFRDKVRVKLAKNVSDEILDHCWNAMLGDIPQERIQLLERLYNTHRTFLLSNTNEIHLKRFSEITRTSTGKENLDPYFHKTYYSHRMKMRKPDAEIFEYVLKENDLDPHETLFLDDNLSNLEGAQSTGIKTFHVERPELIFSLFA